jgi:antitoxin CptB
MHEGAGMTSAPTFSHRLARARFRAWHRGTREADLMIGGFFDRHHAAWGDPELAWFEALLDEDDVDVMAWALGARQAPPRYAGALLQALQKLDYVTI